MERPNLARKLLAFCENGADPNTTKAFSQDLMNTFLQIGSETADNLNCVKHIEYGLVTDSPYDYLGLKVKDKNILLSDVMNTLENMKMPEVIREAFPELTEADWNGIARMTTMIFVELECKQPIQGLDKE